VAPRSPRFEFVNLDNMKLFIEQISLKRAGRFVLILGVLALSHARQRGDFVHPGMLQTRQDSRL